MDTTAILGALKSKTVWLGLVIAILSWVQSVIFQSGIDPDQLGYVGTVLGAIIVFLRSKTTTSLSDK